MSRKKKRPVHRHEPGMVCELCAGRSVPEYVNRARAIIEKAGFFIQYVGGGGYAWAYTVGFWPNHPEIAVIGLQPELTHELMWTIKRRIDAGETFGHGDVVEQIIGGGYKVCFIEIDDPVRPGKDYGMGMARKIHRDQGLRALQMVLPDRDGHFPWEPSYDLQMGVQPLLGPAPSDDSE